jgi:hypothetical protein
MFDQGLAQGKDGRYGQCVSYKLLQVRHKDCKPLVGQCESVEIGDDLLQFWL